MFKVQGFDEVDLQSVCKAQIQQVCNFLTFDTLRYITSAGTLTEEIRNNHNLRTSFEDADTGENMGVAERNERYQNLQVSDWMTECIDGYLQRPYQYENHFSNFDKCVQLFAQGVRNEELSQIAVGLPEPYVEQAIVNYMSSLEVITLNDREPELCECCGQMRYSIARRVIDLANSIFPDRDNFAKDYYGDRSKYVHTGALFSSNNYINRTIPIMSISSRTGMIDQIANIDNGLKDLVKECIPVYLQAVANICNQLMRAGTSVGANNSEATSAISKADYKSKSYIALKEARESLYWINLLHRNGYLDEKQYESIYADADELVRILVARCKKLDAESEKE